MYTLLRRVVLLVSQVSLQWVGFNHLHVLQYQRSAVFLGVGAVVLLAFSQSVMGDSQLFVSDPLFSHHGLSGLLHLVKVLVVDVIERHQLVSLVVLISGCNKLVMRLEIYADTIER